MSLRVLPAACALLALAACEPGPRTGASLIETNAANREERYCDLAGLDAPLRQTIVLIDQSSVVPATTAATFRERNQQALDVILTVADPERAVAANALEPRERVTVYALPTDGSAARLLFSGCAPGFSRDEIAEMNSGKSSASKLSEAYFGSGAGDKAIEAAKKYRRVLLGSVLQSAFGAGASDKPEGGIDKSGLVRSLQSSTGLFDAEHGVPRVVLLSNLAGHIGAVASDIATARTAGFEAATRARLDFGRAEMHVALVDAAGGEAARQYASAFLLGSKAVLHSWAGAGLPDLPRAPTSLRQYSGVIDLIGFEAPMQVRLAAAEDNVLVNSWVILRGEREISTPLTGLLVCEADGCAVRGDKGGFAQHWSSDPDEEPEFDPAMPFGGLRYFELREGGADATGRVYDPVVSQIGASGQSDLKFELTAMKSGKL